MGQLLDRLRQEDLASLRHPEKPGEAVEGRREIVIMLGCASPVCSAIRTRNGPGGSAQVSSRGALGRDGGERVSSGGKGGLVPSPTVL